VVPAHDLGRPGMGRQLQAGNLGDALGSAREPVGKKLDFLAQEILRELNTLGSKGRDLQIIREVLEMKSEIEKIREQVQNLE
ncbi:MAG TPA: DUF1732 domain-containing protein, partial [Thermoanaerobaculia bacterium]|nr:DUF1732 domain-containing protein [Thermoanaerobaculia bacterium]